MNKHIDFTKYVVIVELDDDDMITLPIISATGSETCEHCGVAPAEFVVDASDLGDAGYPVGYCYEHAVVSSEEAWKAGESWQLVY